jgi:hypothetical protein
MLFVGLLAPVLIGWWLLGKRRGNALLSLLGLAGFPLIVWGASLGAKVGPCDVPDCMTSTQHSQLVFSIVSLVIVLAAFGLLAWHRATAGGIVLIVGLAVGAYSLAKTDLAGLITLLALAAGAAAYLLIVYFTDREAKRVPDFPPVA